MPAHRVPLRISGTRGRLVLLYVAVALGLAPSALAAPLVNGGSVTGVLSAGGLDTWEFSASTGDHVLLRIADTGPSAFRPEIELRAPGGASIDVHVGIDVATIEYDATQSGTFTVDVTDFFDTSTGSYELFLVLVPGANEHGLLANDSVNTESITIGDLDSYTFTASAGDSVTLRVAELSGTFFAPRIELYDPSGAQVGAHTGLSVATVEHDVTASGTFSVIVRDDRVTGGQDDGVGVYELRFVRIPGAGEHGALANDSINADSITLGDLDTYTFSASTGDHITLRIAELSGTFFGPRIELYDPSGAQIAANTGLLVATVEHSATVSGTFTVLVRDDRVTGGQDDGVGVYELRFALIPGANELGTLVDGVTVADTIDLGDLDTYVFASFVGANITLDVTEVGGTALAPRVELYGPDGALVAADKSATIASLALVIPAAGTYTVLVRDDTVTGGGDTGSGDYEILFTSDLPPPGVPLPPWALALLFAALLRSGWRRLSSSAGRQ